MKTRPPHSPNFLANETGVPRNRNMARPWRFTVLLPLYLVLAILELQDFSCSKGCLLLEEELSPFFFHLFILLVSFPLLFLLSFLCLHGRSCSWVGSSSPCTLLASALCFLTTDFWEDSGENETLQCRRTFRVLLLLAMILFIAVSTVEG